MGLPSDQLLSSCAAVGLTPDLQTGPGRRTVRGGRSSARLPRGSFVLARDGAPPLYSYSFQTLGKAIWATLRRLEANTEWLIALTRLQEDSWIRLQSHSNEDTQRVNKKSIAQRTTLDVEKLNLEC